MASPTESIESAVRCVLEESIANSCIEHFERFKAMAMPTKKLTPEGDPEAYIVQEVRAIIHVQCNEMDSASSPRTRVIMVVDMFWACHESSQFLFSRLIQRKTNNHACFFMGEIRCAL